MQSAKFHNPRVESAGNIYFCGLRMGDDHKHSATTDMYDPKTDLKIVCQHHMAHMESNWNLSLCHSHSHSHKLHMMQCCNAAAAIHVI